MSRRKRNQAAESKEGLSGRKRAMIFGLVALVAGAACLVIVNQMVESFRQQIASAQIPATSAKVVLAAHDLYQGNPITSADIRWVDVPLEFMPGRNDALVFTNPQEVIGRVPRERILANEYLRDDRLSDAEQGIGLNGLIDKGYRALSVGVTNDKALSGFLHPKDYVDILVTVNNTDDDGVTTTETHTIAQAVYVLAVNDNSGAVIPVDATRTEAAQAQKKQNTNAPSVTLHVTPQQAEEIAHAEREGKIHLSLRSKSDIKALALGSVNDRDITGEAVTPPPVVRTHTAAKPVEAPVEAGPTIRFVRGGNVSEHEVNEAGKTP